MEVNMPKKLQETDTIPYLSTFKGLYKKELLKNQNDFDKLCDYLEKIKWSIEDFNAEFLIKDKWEQKDIVFILTLTCWIWDVANKITKLYPDDVIKDFEDKYKKQTEFLSCKEYFRAIRSFTIAHPLGTTQCPKYEFNGDWICVDIRTSRDDYFAFNDNDIYHLSIDGLKHKYCKSDDIFLRAYSNKDGGYKYFRQIGISSKDLVMFAHLAIDRIAKLNTYLAKQKL